MTGFVLVSSEKSPPVPEGDFPRYIQFRFNGVDLGGPDATVVDFVGEGFTVTRGTGVNANKITVSAT